MKQKFFFQPINFFQIWKLILLNYWANKFNLFNDFVLPLLLVAILVSALGKQILIDFYPGLIAAPLLSIGFISFPSCYGQWKKSSLFKRLKMCGFHTFWMSFLFGCFYFLIAIITINLTFFYCWFFDKYVVQPSKTSYSFLYFVQNLQWTWFVLGLLELQIILFGFGFVISHVTKNEKSILGIGIVLLMIHTFLLGCYIPMRYTLRSSIISTFAYVLPGYAPLRILQASFLTIPEFANDPLVTHLDSNWNLHFRANDGLQIKSFSFSNQFYWHALFGGIWLIIFPTIIVLREKLGRE